MMHWQYRVVEIEQGIFGTDRKKAGPFVVDERRQETGALNQFATEGWEPVIRDAAVYVLRRASK
jgi:hypothetical protein